MLSEQLSISDAANKPLAEWQQILFAHFTELSKIRKEKNISVFAIEHGLRPSLLKIIFLRLVDDYRLNTVNKAYWLLWVIYSTEQGYNYAGDEYWKTFEEKLRNWDSSQRENIRTAFKEFQRRFNGVVPSGPWAQHFSIIAWPITHAILPLDLQFYFARLLFISRYSLKNVSSQSPEEIGKLLAKSAFEFTSSRFLNFLQHEELVGRIALAILGESSELLGEHIYKPTLERIIEDLEQKRNAKQLVQGARGELKPKLYGVRSSVQPKSTNDNQQRQSSYKKTYSSKTKIKLQLIDENSWRAIVEIPRLAEILDSAELIEALKKSRIKIQGVESNWLPGDVILNNSLTRKLIDWPSKKSLINFENKDEALTALTKDNHLSEAPWLFILETDGFATEVISKTVRPGNDYILILPQERFEHIDAFPVCELECKGALARKLEIPSIIEDQEIKVIQSFGLTVQRNLRVWPAGLSAHFWDGEGTGEWLTTESPCLGFLCDYKVAEFQITIDDFTVNLKGKSAGEPTFIRINPLAVGNHIVTIQAKSDDIAATDVECFIHLQVKEPEGWIRGSTLHNGLSFQLDPFNDDLDSLLSNKTQLKVFGPKNRHISLNLDFFIGRELFKSITSKPIVFPFESNELKIICDQAAKDESLADSQKLRLRISCEDIGHKDILFTRKLAPLRWLLKTSEGKFALKLIDETDSGEQLKLIHCDLNQPEAKSDISSEDFSQYQNSNSRRGMFFARRGNHNAAIVTSFADLTGGFGGLAISPELEESTALHIPGYLSFISTWYNARCSGFISQLHHEKVIETISVKLMTHLCGKRWANEEKNFIYNQDISESIENLAQSLGDKTIQNVVRFRLIELGEKSYNLTQEVAWLHGALKRCDICHYDKLISFALEISSTPLKFANDRSEAFSKNLNSLVANKVLIRTCRLFVLSTARYNNQNASYQLINPSGWQ